MYYPYFRGKQYELITVREMATLMAARKFVPIIEPVKESLGGLNKALTSICEAGGDGIVIVNPQHGDHSSAGDDISAFLASSFLDYPNVSAGILLRSETTVAEATTLVNQHEKHAPTLIHAGFTEAKQLVTQLGGDLPGRHVFFQDYSDTLYRRNFRDGVRIVLKDGFKRMKNSEYPPLEPFSDLHVVFEELNMDGFGDFLIVGDDYMESGGPAYAVAIHITFIDPNKDDAMFIYHFKSIRKDTPTDPAGKFGEALEAMIQKLDTGTSMIYETEAIKEFRELQQKRHFPGLGYVKKLSMEHHIETLVDFFDE